MSDLQKWTKILIYQIYKSELCLLREKTGIRRDAMIFISIHIIINKQKEPFPCLAAQWAQMVTPYFYRTISTQLVCGQYHVGSFYFLLGLQFKLSQRGRPF